MNLLIVTFLLTAILGAGVQSATSARDDYLIVPAQRIGLISVNMSPDEAVAAVNRVHKARPSRSAFGRGESVCWDRLRICALFVDDRAGSINTTNSRYATKQGLRTGIPYREAVRPMGQPEGVDRTPNGDVVYWPGLEVEVDIRRIVATIAVNAPVR